MELLNEDSSIADILRSLEIADDVNTAYWSNSLLLRKVDAWREYLDNLEDQAKRHRIYAKEHADRAQTLEKKQERSEAYLVALMQEKGYEKLPGNEWQVSLRKSQRVEIDHEPDLGDVLTYAEVINKKYSWDKKSLKEALPQFPDLYPFAKLTDHYSTKFGPKKIKK